jgi:hypothetical protein
MDIDKIINIIREQNLKVGRKLPADLRMGGGGGGTNVLTSQAKARTIRSMLTDPSGRRAERRFKNDPQTKLDEDMGAGAVSGPTNNVGDGKIAGTVQAGDDPPVKKKRKPTPIGRYRTRVTWTV